MRKTAETSHGLPVLAGRLQATLDRLVVRQLLEKGHAGILVGKRFAVHQRHIEEPAFEDAEFLVEALRKRALRDLGGISIRGVHFRIVAKHVARELIQRDD